MSAARRGLPVAVLLCALALAACGGGGEDRTEAAGGGGSPEARVPAKVLAKANATCKQLLHDVKQVGKDVLSAGYPTTTALFSQGFFAPAMRLLERTANRQQDLERETENSHFHRYAGLFDPILVLAGQSLRATRSGNSAKAKQLEGSLEGLGEEQRKAARLAGLRACDVDFVDAMVNAAF